MSGPPHSAPAPYGPNVWDVPLPKPAEEMKVFQGILPDFETGSRRMECRPAHIIYAKVAYQRGWIISGGAIFRDEDSTEMVGSHIIFRALNLQHAKEMLAQDVYATGGAWDLSKAELRPVAIAPLASEGDAADFTSYLESAKK
ncbi:YciI family protein [Rhodotorula paludigena]|uniref:YciI family protein n=1 Tax=Rhodotorula paludigena TaxID=86838 RepID=UPI003173BF55